MKLYVSGPMSGMESFNIPAFDQAARRLRRMGHEVVSPAELDHPEFRMACIGSDGKTIPPGGETWGTLLARDVKLLADDGIEGIVVLPGWTQSRGALLETYVGRLCGLPIYKLIGNDLRPITKNGLQDAHRKAAGYINGVNAKVHFIEPLHECGIEPTLDTAESVQANAEVPANYSRVVTFVPPQDEKGVWTDEVRVVDPTTGGEKGVKDEVEGDLCPKALIEVAKVCGFGRRKYSRANYLKGYAWSSSYDAMQRHLKAFWAGEEINDESGLHHLAHGAWHALALLAFVLRKVGTDDRL